MNGLCGWWGLPPAAGETNSIARRMVASLDAPVGPRGIEVNVGGAVAVSASVSGATDIRQVGRLIAAVDGRPWWDDPHLSDIAKQDGTATALISGFMDVGVELLTRTYGTFALAIVDTQSDELWLCVDRMGSRPIAYVHLDGQMVFGSTLDCLRAHPAVTARIDPQAIYNLLYCSMIPSPDTVYAGIAKLEPGQLLHFTQGRISLRSYWQPNFDETNRTPVEDLSQELMQLLRQAVTRAAPRCDAGVFLSGGLDSSTVCGVYSKLCPTTVHSFSIGFDVDGYDEMEYARIAAKHFHVEAHEYYVTPHDVVDAIGIIARSYDEPFANSSAVPTYLCARLAREHGVKVMLAGDGGDEIFAGNARYAKQQTFELYARVPRMARQFLLEPLLFAAPPGDRPRLLSKARSYVQQARIPLPDRLEIYNHLYRSDPSDVFTPEFLEAINLLQPLEHLRDVYARAPSDSTLNRMLYLDWKLTLADNDLRKVNRMCEVNGVEVRYPMLDDVLVAFSTRVPSNLKIKRRRLRYFYKRAMTKFLPPEILTKRKHGFGLPFGQWLRSSPELQQTVHDALESLKSRAYIRSDYIQRLTKAHRDEHAAYYGSMLWSLTILESWLQAHTAR